MNWKPKFLCSILKWEVTSSAVCQNTIKKILWVSTLRKQLQIFVVISLCNYMINNDCEYFNILLININPYLSPIIHPMNHNSKEWNISFIYQIFYIYYHPIDFFLKSNKKRTRRKEVTVFPKQNGKIWIYFESSRGGVIGTIFNFVEIRPWKSLICCFS